MCCCAICSLSRKAAIGLILFKTVIDSKNIRFSGVQARTSTLRINPVTARDRFLFGDVGQSQSHSKAAHVHFRGKTGLFGADASAENLDVTIYQT